MKAADERLTAVAPIAPPPGTCPLCERPVPPGRVVTFVRRYLRYHALMAAALECARALASMPFEDRGADAS